MAPEFYFFKVPNESSALRIGISVETGTYMGVENLSVSKYYKAGTHKHTRTQTQTRTHTHIKNIYSLHMKNMLLTFF